MTIFTLLKSDHVKILDLMDDLIDLDIADDSAVTRIGKIRDELVPHARAEEAIFYNALRVLDAAKDLVSHSYREHMEAETLLRTMQFKCVTEMNWKNTAVHLRKALAAHIHEEETKVWAAAKQVFTAEEADMMADAFRTLKSQIINEGLATTTLELAANLMPPRFAKLMGGLDLETRI